MPQPADKPQETAVDIETGVDAAIDACGGDVRAALRTTLITNAYLDAEVDRLTAAVSTGFARGRVRKKAIDGDGANPTADHV